MIRPSDVLPLVQPALADFIAYLGGQPVEAGASLDDLAKKYQDLKGRLGRDAVAGRMSMNENDLTAFDATLREAVRRVGRLQPDAQPIETRNAIIAGLRLLSWLESIADRSPEYDYRATIGGLDDEVGRKQVRALELIIRSLITERYEDQPKLVARLKDLLSEKVVQQWLTASDRGDVLSGTTFSELSSLFVNTTEFPNYEPLYKESPLLTLLKEKRITIRNYLDDIRRIRNVLAHNKRITPTQIALLNLYYDEIVEPLQEAHDQGRTKVNPDLYLDVSAEELDGYFGKLSDDIKGVKDDIADLRADLGGRIDEVKKDTTAIRESTTRIERGTRSANRKLWLTLAGITAAIAVAGVTLWFVLGLGDKTQEIATDTKDIKESQNRTEAAIGKIAEGFDKLSSQGGLIDNADTPEEHYHNALVYESKGDQASARREYLAFAEFDVDAVDVYDRLATLVRAQDGASGARTVFADLAGRLTAPAIKLIYATQFDDAARRGKIEEFMSANPDYGPGFYLLSREFSEARTGGSSVSDKTSELALLKKFLDADQAGTLINHFVDQQVLGNWLRTAEDRIPRLEEQLSGTRAKPTMVQMRSNQGWIVTIMLPEAALALYYRIGETGDFIDNGVGAVNDQRTGKPMPNLAIMLPNDQQPTKIYIKYLNADGMEMGPFELDFRTSSALQEEHKRNLEMIWTSWIAIQANPGNETETLAYFTMLASYTCGIEAAMYSIDSDAVDQQFTLPPCNEKDPMAMPGDFLPFIKVPGTITNMWVQLTYRDGTQSMKREFKPQ